MPGLVLIKKFWILFALASEPHEDTKFVFNYYFNDIVCQHGESHDFRIFQLNCQRLNTTFDFLVNLANFNCFHVLALAENWLSDHNSALLEILRYILFTQNRELRHCGGLAAYVCEDLRVKIRNDPRKYNEMVCETLVLEARLNNVDAYLVNFYRSPSSSIQKFFENSHE